MECTVPMGKSLRPPSAPSQEWLALRYDAADKTFAALETVSRLAFYYSQVSYVL